MSGFVEMAGAFALTWCLHGTLLLALAWAIHALARGADVLRETAWRAALLGSVVTAVVAFSMGSAPVAGGTAVERSPLAARETPAPPVGDALGFGRGVRLDAATTSVGAPFPAADAAIAPHRTVDVPVRGVPSPTLADGASEVVAVRSSAGPGLALSRGVARIAGLLALAAALFGLSRLGLRRVALRRLLCDRREVLDAAELATLRRLADAAGLPRIPRLTASSRLDVPIAFGTLHPEICVPAKALTGLPAAAREAMLAHELAHLAGRDPLWLELAHTLEALFPWQPLLGVARRRLDALAEYRCDAVGGSWSDPLAIADCLVEVATWLGGGRGRSAPLGVVGMAAERGGLSARVDRLLDDPTRGVPGRGARFAATAFVVAGIALSAATLPALAPPSDSAAARDLPTVDVPIPAAVEPDADGVAAVTAPARRAPPPVAELEALVATLEVEQLRLELEVESLRAEILRLGATEEFDVVLRALDARIADLDRRRRALAAEIEAMTGAPGVAPVRPDAEHSDRRR